ncbi:MAG: spinster family MFS transporter [Pseudomonadales bacterium]
MARVLPTHQPGTSAQARTALLLLFLAYALSITDRMILSVLIEPIRLEFGASDTQMGLLGGLSFALFYATLGVPIAKLADRADRRLIIVCSLALFSLMTALSGAAVSFLALFLLRIGVGIGEAGVNPASQSIIADYYPQERRGTAMSVLAVGAPVGMIGGFLVGGAVSEAYGWRMALIAVGLPGLVLAGVIYFLLREPSRGAADGPVAATGPAPSVMHSATFMFTTPALRQLLIASTLTGMMSYGASTWLPTFFVRTHALSQSEVGLIMALLFGGLGAVGTLVGGRLFDVVSRKGAERGVWMIGIVQLTTIPFSLLAYQAGSFSLAILLLVLPAFAGNFFLGPVLALIQTLSPVPMRAVAAAIKMLCLNLVGLSLGPLIVGLISDQLKTELGDASIGIALSVLALLHLWSALHFWLCGRAMQKSQAAIKSDFST